MTSSTMHPLAAAYLDRLRREASHLPPDRREDLIREIEAHLTESIAPGASEAEVRTALDRLGDPAQIVAEDAAPASQPGARSGKLERLAQVLLLMGGFIGGLVGWGLGVVLDSVKGPQELSVVGTTIVIGALSGWALGVVLLWISPVWTVGSKLVGTLVLPGGLLAAAALPLMGVTTETCFVSPSGGIIGPTTDLSAPTSHMTCTGGAGLWLRVALIALWIALIVLPILSQVYLGRRASRPLRQLA